MFFCSSSRQTYEIGQLTTSKLWRKPPSSTSTLHCRIQADDILRFGRVRYFAFGSNMNPGVMQGLRQVKPIKSCPGVVNQYKLAFNLVGTPAIEPSFASAEPSDKDDDELHGVLYTLTRSDWQKVARTEGVGFAYNLEEVVVHTYEGRKLQAVTLRTKPGLLRAPFGRDIPPSKGYLDLLIKGAEFYNLKEEYIDKLKSIQPNPAVFVNTKDMYDLLRINIGN
uniref:gamma-glutamylcyclotransferase n=1 Tax=Hanusia phi TaxID=3032 RepID=A0A7S0ER49_9CRYP